MCLGEKEQFRNSQFKGHDVGQCPTDLSKSKKAVVLRAGYCRGGMELTGASRFA